MDLERELRALPIEWPATPQLRPVLARRRRRRRRWPLVAAIALAAVAAALAVPQSRGAILRFFDIGADKIEVVDTLPYAQQRALDAGLGRPATLVYAHRLVPTLLLPPAGSTFALRASGSVISTVFLSGGKPVLLSELGSQSYFLKKLVGGQTNPDWVRVRGAYGVWLAGKPHIFFFPREPARLAGNTLIWQGNDTTYRLEAPGLTKREALDLARSLRDTP
jgi:hypothetical protein